ncbi:MAG: inositol monophosphatase [Spirochaetia bacterium]|jgi:myo-inositol-1(or 4)-monophosphatase|nr:inositol monophosphatase [Spirochaetia bacterium]
MMEIEAYGDFVQQLAADAGALALSYWKSLDKVKAKGKGSGLDIVTEADEAVEKYIREAIGKRYPTHAIYGEEGGMTAGDDYRWVIDPIDGTVSFFHGQFHWAVSIALQYKGQTIVGIVTCPAYGLSFFAMKGSGATMNGKPISPSTVALLSQAVACTGFCCIRSGWKENGLPLFDRMAPKVQGIRRLGSIATDISFVACGKLDVCWEMNVNLYDVAAALLIAEEAGAKVTDMSGKTEHLPNFPLVSNGLLHGQVLEVFKGFDIPYQNRKGS